MSISDELQKAFDQLGKAVTWGQMPDALRFTLPKDRKFRANPYKENKSKPLTSSMAGRKGK